jgi:uncharacterized protein (TIGR02246 family)
MPRGSEATYSVGKDGKPAADHTYWKGFERGTAAGLVFEHLAAGGAGAPAAPASGLAPSARAEPAAPVAPAATGSPGDERDIRRLATEFQSAWAVQDGLRIGRLWTADGDMLHPDGTIERGPLEIARHRAAMFAQRRFGKSRHPVTVTQVKFRGRDVAVVDGRWEMTNLRREDGLDGAPPMRGLLTWVVQRTARGWRIAGWRDTVGEADARVAR